jgi:serine/threonine protein kinase
MIGASAFIGRLIGSYRIVAVISSSPFHHVYWGEQHFHTGHTVAIKLWHNLHLSPQKQLHFLQEARLLKMLKHPHLLPILEMGIDEDMPYLITAYAPKGSLRDRIERQSSSHPVPLQEIVTLLSQVGQVLQYIHQYDITHGNLKPENILLTAGGEALLTDLTFSTLVEAASSASTQSINSAHYMAPEQFQGTTSKASDQYALGCIAYELLTGRVPFTAVDLPGLERKHATESPLALTELNMLLPIHIEEAVLTALAKQQTARHDSMKDFIIALGTAPFQPRLLIAPAALPALSSSQFPARLPSTVDMFQGIMQQVEGDSTPRNSEHAHISSDTRGHIETLFPVRPEEFEEEEGHLEDMKPLAASPVEVLEEGAEGIQVYTNRVTEGVDVSEQENAILPLIEGPHIQQASQEQTTLPLVAAVNSRTELVTYASAIQAVPPVTVGRMSRGRRSGNQGSRYLWLAITISSMVIVAMLIGLSSFALPSIFSPGTTAHMTPQTTSGGPSAASSPVPSPIPPASPSSQPSPRPTPTPKATPTPRPTPTPSPMPAPGLTVTPGQFSAETDCTWHAHWYTCSATLSAPQSNQGNLAWSASSSGLDQVIFNPSVGVLSPGQQQQVSIRVRSNCPNAGSLIFSGGGRTVTVPWSC